MTEQSARALSKLDHDLRAPLSVIVGYAELLRTRDDEETRREAPERILSAARQLANLVDDLLTVFALEAGVLVVDPAAVDLDDAVRRAVVELGTAADTHTFVVDPPDAGLVVQADEPQLARILRNLLLNACAQSPDGGEVRVSARRNGSFVSVTVSDQGPGLDEEQLSVVFDRFAAGRSGLELDAVKRLVELHGGSVSATSEAGRGSSITFTLPVADDDVA